MNTTKRQLGHIHRIREFELEKVSKNVFTEENIDFNGFFF